jgi:hypothetical protein
MQLQRWWAAGAAWHHAHSVTGPLGGRRPCRSLSRRSMSVPRAFLEGPLAKLADMQRSKGPTKAGASLQAGTGAGAGGSWVRRVVGRALKHTKP